MRRAPCEGTLRVRGAEPQCALHVDQHPRNRTLSWLASKGLYFVEVNDIEPFFHHVRLSFMR